MLDRLNDISKQLEEVLALLRDKAKPDTPEPGKWEAQGMEMRRQIEDEH